MKYACFLTPQDDLQQALDSAPKDAFVHLAAGIYRQKIVIRTPGLTIVGQGAENTILIFDDYAQKPDEQGREYITFRTYTLAVCADGVQMEHLSIVNDARSPEKKGQEVALTVYSDDFQMENCRLTCEEGVTPGSIYLARPWRDYGLTTFRNCRMDRHIAPAGFDKWNDTHRDQTARFYESPAIPGRVPWSNREG